MNIELDAVVAEGEVDPLRDAIRLAEDAEIDWPRDLDEALEKGVLDAPPYNRAFGVTRPRGGANGVVSRAGRLLATWGEPDRADFTFSVVPK